MQLDERAIGHSHAAKPVQALSPPSARAPRTCTVRPLLRAQCENVSPGGISCMPCRARRRDCATLCPCPVFFAHASRHLSKCPLSSLRQDTLGPCLEGTLVLRTIAAYLSRRRDKAAWRCGLQSVGALSLQENYLSSSKLARALTDSISL